MTVRLIRRKGHRVRHKRVRKKDRQAAHPRWVIEKNNLAYEVAQRLMARPIKDQAQRKKDLELMDKLNHELREYYLNFAKERGCLNPE